jgi:hypothetical protein
MGSAESEHESCSPANCSSGCSVLTERRRTSHTARTILARIDPKTSLVVLLFLTAVVVVLFTDNSANPRVRANFSGPPAGFTGAPGELICNDCHTTPTQSSGSLTLNTPSTYTPGQTYNITVTHLTSDATKKRWGFELTALDGADQKAGTLTSLSSVTQVINNQGPISVAPIYRANHNWKFSGTAIRRHLDISVDRACPRVGRSNILRGG